MCDTVCALTPRGVLFGKNSDREPGEAQPVEVLEARRGLSGNVRCTHLEVPQVESTRGLILSRPAWMWGCEMGANDAGLVGGNEAVFTRFPVPKVGLTGMDLLRLTLERAASAREAIEVLIELLGRHPQGGPMGFRNRGFRYHSSFLFADAGEAWVLETAGEFWAAEQVKGVRTISNALSISRPDLVHPGAEAEARRRGWILQFEAFDFAQAFTDPLYRRLTGGPERRACTTTGLGVAAEVTVEKVCAVLRGHQGRSPAQGLTMGAPCAHASWQPTRHAGQTTASMVSELAERGARHFFTGTSSPCLSVFKPVSFELATADLGPAAGVHDDHDSLWWRHERLHRAVLSGYDGRHAAFEADQVALETRALASSTPAQPRAIWQAHREAVPGWLARAEAVPRLSAGWLFEQYWRRQARRDFSQ